MTQLEYHILEELPLLPQEEVKSHTLSHYVDRLGQALGQQHYVALAKSASHPVGLSLLSQKIFFLPIQMIRICPVCLLEQKSYDRLYWRLQLILYCPLHRVPLLGKCPSCGMPIAANRPLARICQRCQDEYREIAQPRLSSTNFYSLSERFLLRALGAKIQEDAPADEAIARSPVSSLSSNSYLYFLHDTQGSLSRNTLSFPGSVPIGAEPQEYVHIALKTRENSIEPFGIYRVCFVARVTMYDCLSGACHVCILFQVFAQNQAPAPSA